ncbi:MAG: hypothetical protein ACK55D_16955 [Synechococcaceae cyanobacterium]|jgi:hypothetical protein
MPASKIGYLHGWDEFKDPAVVDWKCVRRLIEHEDQLVNQRITWLLSSQSFLLLLIGAMMSLMGNQCAASSVGSQFCQFLSADLMLLPPLIGMVTSAFTAITISQAERQSRVVTEWWHTQYPNGFSYNPPAFPSRPDRQNLFACWFRYSMLASIFAAAWLGLIIALVHIQRSSSTFTMANPGVVLFFVLQMVLAVPYVYLAYGNGEAFFDQTELHLVSPREHSCSVNRERRVRNALRFPVCLLRRMYVSRRLRLGLLLPAVFLVIALFDSAMRGLFMGSLLIALFTIVASMLAYVISEDRRRCDELQKQKICAFREKLCS